MKILLIALISYLLGSLCASIPLSKRFCGGDVRMHGSGNAGATNMARVYGMKAGLVTLLLDMLKTIVAIRQYNKRLGFSEKWISDFVYQVVMLAKKEPKQTEE